MHSRQGDSANDCENDDVRDYVREKTRHIVGRAALRHASRMAEDWKLEEQKNGQLAKRIAIGLFFVVLLGVALSRFI